MPEGKRPRAWKRPEHSFAYTIDYQKLRACERMGINPIEFYEMSPDLQRMLMDYDLVRSSDERVERMELASMMLGARV